MEQRPADPPSGSCNADEHTMNTNRRTLIKLLASAPSVALLAACAGSPSGRAPGRNQQTRGGPGGGQRRRGPPEEAFEACNGKSEGDACAFSDRRENVEGVCEIPRRGEDGLICSPDRRNDDSDDTSDPEDSAQTPETEGDAENNTANDSSTS